ncbi:hypothetical protein BDC45DRAFT_535611 [Circinella umbellata]|nr:hypothetical protein BDC45DRAFT_535611 [Circinella umbellata]
MNNSGCLTCTYDTGFFQMIDGAIFPIMAGDIFSFWRDWQEKYEKKTTFSLLHKPRMGVPCNQLQHYARKNCDGWMNIVKEIEKGEVLMNGLSQTQGFTTIKDDLE